MRNTAVVNIVFLTEFGEKRLSEDRRCGWFKLCMQQRVHLWINSNVQSILLIIWLDHGFANCNTIR